MKPRQRAERNDKGRHVATTGIRVGLWLAEIRRVPTADELDEHFGLPRETARRWRHHCAKVLGVPVPPMPLGRRPKAGTP